MGLIRDRNGTWCVQREVPERLQSAVARVLNNGKRKQVHLKKSLGTKDLKAADNRLGRPAPARVGYGAR
jgi:hypothetical protein